MKSKTIKACLDCKADISKGHSSTQRCGTCVEELRTKPKGTMSKAQIAEATRLAGTVPRDEIARAIGVSLSNLKRSCTGTSFNYFNRYVANPEMVEQVCRYYEKHGKLKTQQKFPNISVRSIVERYKIFKPRQSRWKDDELIELAKFSGLISFKNQAQFFNRPLANEGSIRAAWSKTLKARPGYMHGLPIYKANLFLVPGFPTIQFQEQERGGDRTMVLFCDAIHYLRPDCPEFVKQAIQAMAEFQKKLFGNDPRAEIENIIAAMS